MEASQNWVEGMALFASLYACIKWIMTIYTDISWTETITDTLCNYERGSPVFRRNGGSGDPLNSVDLVKGSHNFEYWRVICGLLIYSSHDILWWTGNVAECPINSPNVAHHPALCVSSWSSCFYHSYCTDVDCGFLSSLLGDLPGYSLRDTGLTVKLQRPFTKTLPIWKDAQIYS